MKNTLTLSQACEIIGVSVATGRNWVRLGKLTPLYNSRPLQFDADYIADFSKSLETGASGALKSRRNKTRISGNRVYRDYTESSENVAVADRLVQYAGSVKPRVLLANLALQLVLKREGNLVSDFSGGRLNAGGLTPLISDLLGGEAVEPSPALYESVRFIPGEDTLGLVYISLRDIGSRKASGAYYTPHDTVKRLVGSVLATTDVKSSSVLDPCCGTGNFLIYMSRHVSSPTQLYGQDCDEISVLITRLNIALSCDIDDIKFLYENFTVGDTLLENTDKSFDIIVGNPPWGCEFTEEYKQLLLERYFTAAKNATESSGLFIERSLSLLKDGGLLALVVPQAVLNIRAHKKTRQVMRSCSFRFVTYVDDAFDGVLCPAVILGIVKDGSAKTEGCVVSSKNGTYIIEKNRPLSDCGFMFDVRDAEADCLDAMRRGERKYLFENAEFALGIVTGDNSKYISRVRSDGLEPVFRGGDVHKYGLRPPSSFIMYQPSALQQTADDRLYRAKEKLLYRFISRTLVFAYDAQGRLSLNSCNILIPKIPGMSIKYVMAALNSRAASFYFQKTFGSVKVLRSHLEKIPLPCASERMQRLIEKKTDLISACPDIGLYDEIDEIFNGLYGLSDAQAEIIRLNTGAPIL